MSNNILDPTEFNCLGIDSLWFEKMNWKKEQLINSVVAMQYVFQEKEKKLNVNKCWCYEYKMAKESSLTEHTCCDYDGLNKYVLYFLL